MSTSETLYRLAASLPAAGKSLLKSRPLGPLRRLIATDEPLTSGIIDYEGHRFEFTAPVTIVDRAQSRGIENRICRLILAELPRGGTAVDVGANFGFLTHVMAAAAGEAGRVVSFEADDRIAEILASSLDGSGIGWVEVVGQAVGTGDRLALDDYEPALRNVDFLKVDVDGPELDVLRSARLLLERDHPVVVVEINRHGQEIMQLLQSVGYDHFMGMSNEPVQPGAWPANLIASTRQVRIPRVPAATRDQ